METPDWTKFEMPPGGAVNVTGTSNQYVATNAAWDDYIAKGGKDTRTGQNEELAKKMGLT